MRSALLLLALCVALAAWPARADDTDSGNKKPEHKITQSKSFVMVEPFYTTIYDAGRPVGMLMVAVGLDIPDGELRNQAETGMPLLRDYYLRNLSNFSATAVRPWQQPDVNEIATRLQRVTDRALHRAGARLLLAQVAIRVSK
jgi:flagellar basal body-associated protein FliL